MLVFGHFTRSCCSIYCVSFQSGFEDDLKKEHELYISFTLQIWIKDSSVSPAHFRGDWCHAVFGLLNSTQHPLLKYLETPHRSDSLHLSAQRTHCVFSAGWRLM